VMIEKRSCFEQRVQDNRRESHSPRTSRNKADFPSADVAALSRSSSVEETPFVTLARHQPTGALHLDFEMWDSTALAPDHPQQSGCSLGDVGFSSQVAPAETPRSQNRDLAHHLSFNRAIFNLARRNFQRLRCLASGGTGAGSPGKLYRSAGARCAGRVRPARRDLRATESAGRSLV
jgi:hypothetical protein